MRKKVSLTMKIPLDKLDSFLQDFIKNLSLDDLKYLLSRIETELYRRQNIDEY